MLSVQQRAESLGTFRWVATRLMRQLAQWIPTTPEMEVKVLFGRHVWDCARQADTFGKRAFELRAPLHYTLPPVPSYQEWYSGIAAAESTADRVAALYEAALPALAARYRRYLAETDPLMDEPTVRIVESALADLARMQSDRNRILEGVAVGQSRFDAAGALQREAALASIVEFGADNARARGVRA